MRSVGSYSLISGLCFTLNNGLLIGMARLGLPLALNLCLSAAVVISLGYVLQSLYTFRVPLSLGGLSRYSLVMAVNLPVAFVLLWLLNHWMPMTYSAPIVTTLLLVWNAIGSIWALRRKRAMVNP
jgi:predicted membrane protein